MTAVAEAKSANVCFCAASEVNRTFLTQAESDAADPNTDMRHTKIPHLQRAPDLILANPV
jgi:hypothetical protein